MTVSLSGKFSSYFQPRPRLRIMPHLLGRSFRFMQDFLQILSETLADTLAPRLVSETPSLGILALWAMRALTLFSFSCYVQTTASRGQAAFRSGKDARRT